MLQKFDAHSDFNAGVGSIFSKGLNFKSETNRDVAILGNCDDGVMKLADALGWKDDLIKLQTDSQAKQSMPTTSNPGASQ